MMGEKGVKRLRFNHDDDIALLKEVIANNPLQDAEQWRTVQSNITSSTGKTFSVRTLKDHLQLLLQVWQKKDTLNTIKSGVEEVYSEKDHLLQEVADICGDFSSPKPKKKISKEQQIAELGRAKREQSALSLMDETGGHIEHDYSKTYEEVVILQDGEHQEEPQIQQQSETVTHHIDGVVPSTSHLPTPGTSHVPTPRTGLSKHKKKTNAVATVRRNALEYLERKEERERMLRTRELDIEEKKLQLHERELQLKERKFELKVLERNQMVQFNKEKFELEVQDRRNTSKLIEAQQEVINTLLARLKKHEEENN